MQVDVLTNAQLEAEVSSSMGWGTILCPVVVVVVVEGCLRMQIRELKLRDEIPPLFIRVDRLSHSRLPPRRRLSHHQFNHRTPIAIHSQAPPSHIVACR